MRHLSALLSASVGFSRVQLWPREGVEDRRQDVFRCLPVILTHSFGMEVPVKSCCGPVTMFCSLFHIDHPLSYIGFLRVCPLSGAVQRHRTSLCLHLPPVRLKDCSLDIAQLLVTVLGGHQGVAAGPPAPLARTLSLTLNTELPLSSRFRDRLP